MDRSARARRLEGLRSARREAQARGKLRGIGLANYIEVTSGAPRECAEITVHAGGPRRRRDRHAVERPGPRDELRAVRRRMARRAVRTRPPDPGRHRHRADRRRLAFRPLDAHGRRRHGQGVGRRSSQKGTQIAAHVLEADASRRRIRATAASPSRAPTARSACSRWRARRANATICPRTCAARWPRSATTSSASPGFPFGSHVCEVEIDPGHRRRSRSCATPRSTTSAARSIR